jgi:glycine oxidase
MIGEFMQICDVAVVGAGVIGQAVAYELASRGASVTLVDARGAGLGSTQASAGMLVPYHEGFGRPILPLAVRSLEMYDAFVERVTSDAGVGVGYRRTGSLHVATDEPLDELRRLVSDGRRLGLECEFLDARAVRDVEPQLTPDVSGGCLVKTHGAVAAPEFSAALSAAAIKRGVRMRVPARVRRIEQQAGHLAVHLEGDAPLAAKHVVVAAGSWSGQLEIQGIPPLPVRPVRGQLLQLASEGPPLHRIVWGARCYLVPSDDGVVLVGATVEDAGFDERATAAGVHDLLDAACDLVPHLWQAAFLGVRVGLRPATPDELPIIGASARMPGLVYATGHYRNGVLLAPLTALAVADLVLNNHADPLLAAVSPQRLGEY